MSTFYIYSYVNEHFSYLPFLIPWTMLPMHLYIYKHIYFYIYACILFICVWGVSGRCLLKDACESFSVLQTYWLLLRIMVFFRFSIFFIHRGILLVFDWPTCPRCKDVYIILSWRDVMFSYKNRSQDLVFKGNLQVGKVNCPGYFGHVSTPHFWHPRENFKHIVRNHNRATTG